MCNAVFAMNIAALSFRGFRNVSLIFCENCVSFWPQCIKFEDGNSHIMSKSSEVGCLLPYSISLLEGKKICMTSPCNFLNYT